MNRTKTIAAIPTLLGLSLSKAQAQHHRQSVAFYTYLLRCSDSSYYVGHTDDIDLRMAQHQTGALGGYTARRRPVELLWSDSFMTRDEAFWAERNLKGWSRAKKEALMAWDWGRVSQLAQNRQGPSTGSG
ncbi:MAG: GIY-YIG nuclease family protein [Croceibacterium sp.]